MGSYCSSDTACCTADKNNEETIFMNPTSATIKSVATSPVSIYDVTVRDEQEVRKLESLMHAKVAPDLLISEICSHANAPKIFQLLRKNDKTVEEFEILLFRDTMLVSKKIEVGSLKYEGQSRLIKRNKTST